MKNLSLLLLAVIFFGCSKTPDNSKSNPEVFIEFNATDEVLQGKGDYGDLTSGTKLLTFAIKNMGTEPLVGPAILEDSSNFKIIYQNNCLTVLPTKTCSVKVNFDTSGKAPGIYTTKLNLDRVFVTLTANVVAPVASGAVEFKSGSTVITSQDFGVLTDIQSVQKTITVKNTTNQSLSLPVSLSTADFNIVYDTCNNKPVAVGATCQIKINLSGAGKTGPISANLVYGSYSLPLSAVINSTASGNIEYYTSAMLVEEINYGEVNPSQTFLQTITIKNTGLVPVSYPVIVTGNGYNLIYDMCSNKNIAPQGTCLIKINYIVPDMTGENNATVVVNSVVLDLLSNVVIPPPPEVTKLALTNFNPNNGIVNFGNVEQYSGETPLKSMTIRNLSGAIQKFTVAPVINNYTIVNNGCFNVNINRSGYCTISFKFNSDGKNIQNYDETFLMENATHKIEFQLKANVIASSSVIACDMTNATAGGGVDNSNGKVLEVEGNFPLCTVKTCDTLYQASGDVKSCVPVTVACTNLDATANGVNFSNSNNTVKGQVVAGDVSQCLLADTACNLNYVRNVSGKTCDEEVRPCLEADAVANGVNISNVNSSLVPPYLGNVVAGNVSACVINQCVAGYTKDGAGKQCIQDSRACTGADIIGLGGNTANALTYSGQVVMNDPSACKIATCSGTFEPSTSGLICENKVMSSLSFTIANKNTNGYVKDSFLQLNSATINALEMKISDNATCTSGTWEPFVASKQFTIPAGRLNGSVDVPVSIQYRRNATTSSCIYVPGLITLASSHNYRHDNIAPPTLTINTYTNNQEITVSSLTFSGNCTPSINRETGLFGQALTSAACGGTYTSQLISTATDGIYPLYVKQTDLAGNIKEVTVNVKKVTACNSSNAVAGGVRSTNGALTYSGNTVDGCLIATCDAYTSLAGDAKSCDDRDIVGGSFVISKNANGYVNTSSVTLTSISATYAKNFDIFENATCASTPKDSNVNYTTTRAYTPSTLNHSTDQSVSILFKNGTKTKCVHVAGAITVPSANTYRHDNIFPTPLTITAAGFTNGGTISNPATTSITFAGACDSSVALLVGTYNSETTTTCTSNAYSNKTISGTFGSDTTYTFSAKQTDLAGNTSQQYFTVVRDTKKNLTVNKTGLGNGSISDNQGLINSCTGTCIGRYAPGTTVVLTASPNIDSTFTTWGTVSNAQSTSGCGTSLTCTIVVGNLDVSVSPSFALKTVYNVSVAMQGLGSGTATDGQGFSCTSGTCIKSVYSGDSVTLTATANSNSIFQGWSGTAGCTGTGSCVLTNITSNKQVITTFNLKPTYTLTVSKTGTPGSSTVTGGSISCGATCSQTVVQGDSVTLTANPDANSIFTGWTGGGCSGTNLTCTVSNILANTTVQAGFRVKNNYTFSITKTGGGSINLTSNLGNNCSSTFPCSFIVPEGSNITLSAVYSGSNGFSGWGGACSGTQNTCSFTNVSANQSISLGSYIIPPNFADANRLAFVSATNGMTVLDDSFNPVYLEKNGNVFDNGDTIYTVGNRLVINSNKVYYTDGNKIYKINGDYSGKTELTGTPAGLSVGNYMYDFEWLGQTSSYAYFRSREADNTTNIYSINKSTDTVQLVSSPHTNGVSVSILASSGSSFKKTLGTSTIYFKSGGKVLSVNDSRTVSLVYTSTVSPTYGEYIDSAVILNSNLYFKDNTTYFKVTGNTATSIITDVIWSQFKPITYGTYLIYVKYDSASPNPYSLKYFNTSNSSIGTAHTNLFMGGSIGPNNLKCGTYQSRLYCFLESTSSCQDGVERKFYFTSFPSGLTAANFVNETLTFANNCSVNVISNTLLDFKETINVFNGQYQRRILQGTNFSIVNTITDASAYYPLDFQLPVGSNTFFYSSSASSEAILRFIPASNSYQLYEAVYPEKNSGLFLNLNQL